MATTQEYCEQYWTSPGGNTPQSSSCTATYHTLWKLSKWDDPDIQDTAGRVRKDEHMSDVLLWTPLHGQAKAGHPAKTYIQQFHADTGCSLEDLLEAMNNREWWRVRVREICTDVYIYIYTYISSLNRKD